MITELNTRGLVALALQFLLPLLVGLVTKQSWGSGPKAILLLALSGVTEFLVQLQDYVAGHAPGEVFSWQTVAYATLIGFIVSVASHYGLWKPTGAAEVAQASAVKDVAYQPGDHSR